MSFMVSYVHSFTDYLQQRQVNVAERYRQENVQDFKVN